MLRLLAERGHAAPGFVTVSVLRAEGRPATITVEAPPEPVPLSHRPHGLHRDPERKCDGHNIAAVAEMKLA